MKGWIDSSFNGLVDLLYNVYCTEHLHTMERLQQQQQLSQSQDEEEEHGKLEEKSSSDNHLKGLDMVTRKR